MSVNSSNSDYEIQNKERYYVPSQNFKPKKIKDYVCPCGRSYGSYPALYSHIKKKHDGKPPGQVVKPKPLRRRGRPFKYEPIKLQNETPHKNASRHLQQYLRNNQNDSFNQFPLKDFANQIPQKLNFMYPANDEEQYLRYQYFMNKSRQNEQIWTKDDQRNQQSFHGQRQQGIPLMNQQFQSENHYSFDGNEKPYQVEALNLDDNRIPNNQLANFQQIRRTQDVRTFRNPNISLVNGGLNNEFNQYLQMREQQNRRRVHYGQQQRYDIFESIYSKPYELELRQQMEDKFNPIAQGLSQFLQPILRDLIIRQQKQMREKVINLQDDEEHKGNNQRNTDNKVNEEKNQENREVNVGENVNVNDKQGCQINNSNDGQKEQVQCRQLLENEHLRDIVRWMMTPPQQLSGPLAKENYIENSFRCCLVEFLDFSNQFLQKVQYQQILLVLVFFCDHILASTGSFQNRPQPLVYEMFMYFNSFLSEYIPKLVTFMPALNRLFIFTEYKKKISELFMWMSTWQSVQQYYHNRYFRERILHELQQQNIKSLQYQQKYNLYVNQAQKQNIFSETINSTYPLQLHVEQQQYFQPEEKAEQNPQPIVFNPNQNQIDPQMNIVYTGNDFGQQQDLNENEENVNNQHFDQNQVNIQSQKAVQVSQLFQGQQQMKNIQKGDNINVQSVVSGEVNSQQHNILQNHNIQIQSLNNIPQNAFQENQVESDHQ